MEDVVAVFTENPSQKFLGETRRSCLQKREERNVERTKTTSCKKKGKITRTQYGAKIKENHKNKNVKTNRK